MAVEIRWEPEARDDLQQYDQPVQEAINTAVKELADAPLGHDDVGRVTDRHGTQLWRLKVKHDEVDHRVFFDWDDDQHVVRIYGVFHRDNAYELFQSPAFKTRLK